MEMTTVTLAPPDQPVKAVTLLAKDGTPQTFILPRRWRWAACPLPDLEGLRVEVRTNLTHGETRELERGFPDYDSLFVAMAPHVRAWNVGIVDPVTGTPCLVAPPAEAGPGAFLEVAEAVAVWIRRCLLDRSLDRALDVENEPATTHEMSPATPSVETDHV